jgi:ABC-type phosphate transport system auxiliary subunit
LKDGSKSEKVDLVTDPKVIEALLEKEKEKKKAAGLARRLKQASTPEEEAERSKIRKEKRRLQEQLRRLRRNKEKQDELKRKMLAGS